MCLLACRVFPYLVGREDDNGKGGRFVAALKFNPFQDFEPFEVSRQVLVQQQLYTPKPTLLRCSVHRAAPAKRFCAANVAWRSTSINLAVHLLLTDTHKR